MMEEALVFSAQTIRIATPYLFAALGGVVAERAGVVSLALEGFMLAGAYGAMAGAHASGSAWMGVLCGMVAGLLFASLHALASVRLRGDPIVVGIALNLLAIGTTRVLLKHQFDSSSNSPRIPGLEGVAGQDALSLVSVLTHPLIVAALALVPAIAWMLGRTPFGLRVRACGEMPEAAASVGVNVMRVRTAAVLASGALAGLGGVFLALDQHQFTDSMTAGRGFIALAAVIFGRWRPGLAAVACLLFAMAEALQIRLQGTGEIPSQLVQMIPYVLTLIALVGVVGRSRAPAALGESE